MKLKYNKKYLYWGITAFLVIACSILFYYVLFHRSSFTGGIGKIIQISMPIIDGFVLAYLITPILNKIEKCIIKPLYLKANIPMTPKSKRRMRAMSILLTIVLILVVLYEFFGLIIPEVVRSIQSIIFQMPMYINNLTNWALGLIKDNPDLEAAVNQLINQYSVKILDYVNTNLLPHINGLIKTLSLSVLGIFKALWNFVIGFILSIYVLGSKEKFAGQAKKLPMHCLTARPAMRLSLISALFTVLLLDLSAEKSLIPLSSALFALSAPALSELLMPFLSA